MLPHRLPASPHPLPRRRLLAAAAGLWAAGARAQQGAAAVPVLYPDIAEPFRSVFAQIVEGIAERVRSERLLLAPQADPALLQGELARRRPPVVVALGRASLRLALGLEGAEVVGACIISPAEGDQRAAALHSLSPDPALLLQRLRALLPGVRRVTAVHSARNSAWLMRLAQDAARPLGLELRALEAEDLKAALRHYQDFLAQAGPQDALWLLQDPATVDEATVLPLLLQACWTRQVALFSSNLAHVRRGALFGLYPDNLDLGRSLGQTALALLNRQAGAVRGLQPLREVQAALNTRTAAHLGLDLSPQLQRGFQLLLPER